jgi:hypothetical protein
VVFFFVGIKSDIFGGIAEKDDTTFVRVDLFETGKNEIKNVGTDAGLFQG